MVYYLLHWQQGIQLWIEIQMMPHQLQDFLVLLSADNTETTN